MTGRGRGGYTARVEDDAPTLASPADKLILVVDDDPSITALLEMLLKNEGFRVKVAHDGHEGAAMLEQDPPHLVVTDLMMPRQGGWDFLRMIPGSGAGRMLVFVITGSAIDQSTVQLIRQESGVVEFFPKPIKRAAFVAAAHRHLRTAPRIG